MKLIDSSVRGEFRFSSLGCLERWAISAGGASGISKGSLLLSAPQDMGKDARIWYPLVNRFTREGVQNAKLRVLRLPRLGLISR